MKKLVSFLLVVVCIVTMSLGVMATEDTTVTPDKDSTAVWALTNGKYTVNVGGLTTGGMYGLLALAKNAVLSTITQDDIMYIDQATAVNGSVAFNQFLPKTALALDDPDGYRVYLGGTDLAGATDIGVLQAQQSVHATSVTLSKETLTVVKGSTATLTATILPADAVEKTVTWSSEDPEIATVDPATGVVTAIAEGSAKIQATTANGIYATCAVTVTDGIPGDMNGDGRKNSADAIYLLNHVGLPEDFPITLDGDVNADDRKNSADAIYLLNHIGLPEDFPLYPSSN